MEFLIESDTQEEHHHQDTVDDNHDIWHCVTSETCQSWQVTIFTIGLTVQVVSDGGQNCE